jgi:hypothetical protein
MFNNLFGNGAVYEIMLKNMAEPCRPQMIIWCMGIAFWILKSTYIQSEYVIYIALSMHQYLHEGALILLYNRLSCVPVQYSIYLAYFNIPLNEVAVVSCHREYLFQLK